MSTEDLLLKKILKQLQTREQTLKRERWARTFFSENVSIEREPQILLASSIPLSNQRDIQIPNAGGSITDNDSNFLLDSGNSANGSFILESVARTIYIPGNMTGWGVGVRPISLPTDTGFVRFGLFKNDGGSIIGQYYRIDKDGIWAVVRDDPTGLFKEFKQGQWNLEQLDGKGYGTLDLLNGNMFRGKFGYYGYTPYQHEIGQLFTSNGILDFDSVPVNIYLREKSISLSNPNLPITVEVNGGANGEQVQVEVGGRQAVTYGENKFSTRTITGIRLSQACGAGVFTPAISFKGRTGFEEVRKEILGITIQSDQSGVWRVVEGAPGDGTLAVPPYGYDPDEVATDFNITGTSLGSSTTIASGLFTGTRPTPLTSDRVIGRFLKDDQEYTVELRPNGAATISTDAAIKEYW